MADGAFLGFVLFLVVAHVLPYVFGVVCVWFLYRFLSNWIGVSNNISWFEQIALELGQYYWGRYSVTDMETTKKLISEKLKNLK